MYQLTLDYQKRKPVSWSGVLVLLVSIAVAALSAVSYANISDAVAQREAKLQGIERERMANAHHGRVVSKEQLSREIKAANEILFALATPWDGLLQDIASFGGTQVALLGVEPNAQKRVVRITGEAKNFQAVLDYMKNLQSVGAFSNVYLEKHQFDVGEYDVVGFVLVASWKVNL